MDINSLWKKVRGGSTESIQISDNGYDFSIVFYGKEVRGVYVVYAYGKGRKDYLRI